MKKNELLRGVTAKPMTDADKTRIEIKKEAEEFGNGFVMVASQRIARIGYITGATVWAERLKQKDGEVSKLNEFINASEQFSASQMEAYHNKIAKLINEKTDLTEQLKQERNKAIDECISDLKNKVTKTSLTWKLADELESLKSKPE